MTHWGWYWKIKRKHIPRISCSRLDTLDSFDLLKNKQGMQECMNKVALTIPKYNFEVTLHEDRYSVIYNGGSYNIPIEKKPCNYSGYYYFFHCPKCDKRMRILYDANGLFLCRKCLNLAYYTQRLKPSDRCLIMANKIENQLKHKSGTLHRKPPWMKKRTFEKIKQRHYDYRERKFEKALYKEAMDF